MVGAGVNVNNIETQLRIADGAIIGTYFKSREDTHLEVDPERVKKLMAKVKRTKEDNTKI